MLFSVRLQHLPVPVFQSLVLGVFAGSLLWWLVLAGGVGWLRGRLTSTMLGWINRASGVLIAGFGLWALLATVC